MTTLTVKSIPEKLLKLKAALEEGKRETSCVNDQKAKKTQTAASKNRSHVQPKKNQKPEHLSVEMTQNTKDDAMQLSSSKKSVKPPRPVPFVRNERVMSALDWLYVTFPQLFKKQEKVPLKVGILYDIFVWLEAHKENFDEEQYATLPTKTAIRDGVTFYTMNPWYQKALVEQDKRYDLDGFAVDDVQDVHKTYATERHSKIQEKIKAQNEKRKAYHAKKKEKKAEKANKIATREPLIIEDIAIQLEDKTAQES